MKKEIQMILDHFEKDDDLIIVNDNNFELFNALPKIKSVNRLHVEFKCNRCNSIASRRADTFFNFHLFVKIVYLKKYIITLKFVKRQKKHV